MFVVDRSVFTVLLPIAMLLGVALWFNRSDGRAPATQTAAHSQPLQHDQALAANLPSR
jgi:hypothetical protein